MDNWAEYDSAGPPQKEGQTSFQFISVAANGVMQ